MANKKSTIWALKLEDLEKHTTSKSFAKKIYGLVECANFESTSIADLLQIPGMGRKGALLVMEAVCDIAGKK